MILYLKRSLKSAWLNFRRNPGLSLVAVFAIATTLLFLTFSIIAKDFSNMVSSEIKERITVSVYFKEGVDENTILEVQEKLNVFPDVRNVEYISRQRALEIFIEKNKDNPVLMAALAEVGNPFPASLNIGSDTIEGYERIVAFLEESPSRVFFEKIDYDRRKEMIENIFNVTSTVQTTGIVLATIMGFISILVVFNIVKLGIYGIKEEISIMRLLGVSRKFIVSSFIFQGVITGIAGILVNLLTLAIFILLFGERIAEFIPGLNISFYLITNAPFLLVIQFGTALVLGMSSSLLATTRYLKT